MSTELAIIPASKRDLVLSPVMDLDLARSRMKEFQEFVAHYLEPSTDGGQDGGDYGPIPGAGKKKVLLKSGADKLTELYGLYDEYEVDAKEDFETKLFYYKVKCFLRSRRDDSLVGTGLGSCSTYESKYRWREQQRTCPSCGVAAIIKGKAEYGGGYVCWDKKGGCKGKFKEGDKAIESQPIGRVENPDIMDTVNTVLKMAKKRAKIDAVIGVTRSSGIFTQDLEDLPMPPPKPEVQRTTEDIPIRPVSASPIKATEAKPVTLGGTQAEPPKAESLEVDQPRAGAIDVFPSREPGSDDGDELIDLAHQRALHRAFKDAVRNPEAQKKAADFLRDWLKNQGYVDEFGLGTTKTIPALLFDEVKNAAVRYAAQMPA